MSLRCVFLVLLLATLTLPVPTFAQTDGAPVKVAPPGVPTLDSSSYAVDPRYELLNAAIEQDYKGSRGPRRFLGWSSVISGTAAIGLGVWRFVGTNNGNNEFQRGLGMMLLALGGSNLATGATLLSRGYQEEVRYHRWKALNPVELDAAEISRYEGELRALAYVRERERRVLRWLSMTRMAVGLLAMGLVYVPDVNKASRVNGLITGGVFAATGAIRFGVSFKPTESEKSWKKYKLTMGL